MLDLEPVAFHDVGVVQRREHLRLLHEGVDGLGVNVDNLDRDILPVVLVEGAVDLRRAALANHVVEGVPDRLLERGHLRLGVHRPFVGECF